MGASGPVMGELMLPASCHILKRVLAGGDSFGDLNKENSRARWLPQPVAG